MRLDLEAEAAKTGVSVDAFKRIYRLFLLNTREDLQQLRTAAENSELDRVAELLHHIRGAAINMGVSDLASDGETICEAVAAKDPEQVRAGIHKLAADFTRLEPALEDLF